MTYRELRRSDLLDALFALEREEDINRVSRYFRSAAGSSAQFSCSGARGQQQTRAVCLQRRHGTRQCSCPQLARRSS